MNIALKIFKGADNFERQVEEFLQNPKILLEILRITDFKIKNDYATKLSVFFTGLSAYTKEPLNLFIRGPSSTGKSYNAVEILKLFPEEDVWWLGGLSPTALIHQHGELMGPDGEPLGPPPLRTTFEDRKEYEKALNMRREKARNGFYQVDLTGKILLFLESPNVQTFEMLRPILSHDTFKISYRITDKTKHGSLETKHTVIKGWPATIFLNARDQFLEELATRSFTVSPQEDPEKYRKANELTNTLNCFPWLAEEYENRKAVIQKAIKKIKEKLKALDGIVNTFHGLNEYYPAVIPRDMRDYQHLEQFIKCIAALHVYNRPLMRLKDKQYLLLTVEDVKAGFTIFQTIFETTRTGLSQHVLNFYHKVVKQKEEWDSREIVTAYNEVFKPKRSQKTVLRYINLLAEVGYVDVDEHPTDKRKNVYRPIAKEEEEIWTNRDNPGKSVILSLNLEKEFEKWLEKCGQQTQFYKNVSCSEEIHWDDLKRIILQESELCPNLFQLFSNSKTENKAENKANRQMSQIVPNSNDKPFKSLVQVDGRLLPTEKCALCGKVGVDWQVNYHDGSWKLICDECRVKLEKQLEGEQLGGES